MFCFALLLLTVHSAISTSEMESLIKKVEMLESGHKATQMELAAVKDEQAQSKDELAYVKDELAIQKLEKRADNQIAFSVGANQEATVNNGAKFEFDVIYTNVGSGWNVGSSEFACPITGYYAFSVTTLSRSNQHSKAQVLVGSEGGPKAYSHGSEANGAHTHVALCNAGQIVQMRCVDTSGCNILGNQHTAFSGFLISSA